ncbi:MAG: GatB/YqeY domain-containing protein [Chloroflexi bacterium]|nr:GatB/YqeY domain-containing protein [Chloroflexota bacterium]MCL5074768.1 GatB/YqeY domain-containing protein [Chloroflexota bacterium]
MDLQERLMEDLKEAVRRGDERRRSVIRLARAAIKNAEIEQGRPLDDDDVLRLISKEIKQRHESITEFDKAKRSDLVAKEQAELEILEGYLPPQMATEEIEALARSIIAEVGAKGLSDIGRVMPKLMAAIKGRADGRLANQIVRQLLTKT